MSDPKGKVGWWSDPSGRGRSAPGQALADGAVVAGDADLANRGCMTTRPMRSAAFSPSASPNRTTSSDRPAPAQWGWLEVYPQHAFYQTPGIPEEVAVGVAQNAADGKLSVFTHPRAHGRSFHDGKEPGPEGRDCSGRNFAEQWRRALEIDPAFVFVTNWNEWIAGRFSPANMPLHGTGPVTFVDEFDAEFSRDIEPMKGGHGDNYYYQMVANIRRYKGARPIPPVEPRPIAIDGRFDDWAARPAGIPRHHRRPRSPRSAGMGQRPALRQRDGPQRHRGREGQPRRTGPSSSIVRTRDKLTSPADPNWMLLFIDADQNPKTGWLGYDFVVNRKVRDVVPNDPRTEHRREV